MPDSPPQVSRGDELEGDVRVQTRVEQGMLVQRDDEPVVQAGENFFTTSGISLGLLFKGADTLAVSAFGGVSSDWWA